jgi:hypothetical protein
MADEIIEELWQIKDDIARECGYDLDALLAHLAAQMPFPSSPAVDLPAVRSAGQEDPAEARSSACR